MLGWMTTWKVKCGIATYSSHLIKHLKDPPLILAAKDENSIGGLESGEFRCWEKNSSDFRCNRSRRCVFSKFASEQRL